MATPLTQVVVVKPFLRDTTFVPSKFSIKNFFLQCVEHVIDGASQAAACPCTLALDHAERSNVCDHQPTV